MQLILNTKTQGSDCSKLSGGIHFWMGNVFQNQRWTNFYTGNIYVQDLELLKPQKPEVIQKHEMDIVSETLGKLSYNRVEHSKNSPM